MRARIPGRGHGQKESRQPMANTKREPAQRTRKSVFTKRLAISNNADHADAATAASPFGRTDDARCLSLLLNTSPYDIDGTMSIDRIEDMARGLCGLTRNSLVAKEHFQHYFYRFDEMFPRGNRHFHRKIDDGWNSLGNVFCRSDAVQLLKSCLVYKQFGEISPALLNYILDDPAPDFITLNRLHGWADEMNDPAYFLLAGNELLSLSRSPRSIICKPLYRRRTSFASNDCECLRHFGGAACTKLRGTIPRY